MRLVAVLGSATPPGRLHRAVTAMAEHAAARGVECDVIDLATVAIAPADGRPLDALGDDSAGVVERIAGADAVILASPVYRASLTGVLKNLLDLVPVEALQGKPVGIVAMGATAHHSLGVASHLRDILAWFGALTAPVDVYLTSADFADGAPSPTAVDTLDALATTLTRLAEAPLADLGPAPLAARYTPTPAQPRG